VPPEKINVDGLNRKTDGNVQVFAVSFHAVFAELSASIAQGDHLHVEFFQGLNGMFIARV